MGTAGHEAWPGRRRGAEPAVVVGKITRAAAGGSTVWHTRPGGTVHVTGAGAGQTFLVASAAPMAEPRQAARAAYRYLGDVLVRAGTCIVHERLFGSGLARQDVLAGRAEALADLGMSPDWPVTYVAGRPPWGHGLAGVLIRAVRPGGSEDGVWTVVDGPDPVGRGWRRLGTTFLTLQAVSGPAAGDRQDAPDDRPRQAARTIAHAQEILHGQGLSHADVARTWFYLPDILAWYDQFNQVCCEQYGRMGIFPGPEGARPTLPAGTVVGADSHRDAAGMLDLLAVAGSAGGEPVVRPIGDPGQMDACRHGPTFSRGVVIEEADVRVIEVSGTAAIDASGRSLHPGDARSQIDATLERIESLIDPERATLKDICSGTAFVKRPEHASIFHRALVARGLEPLPVVCVVADLCRPELLFEMDAEVAVGTSRKG